MKKSPLFIYSTRIGAYYHLTPFNQQTLNLETALISAGDFFHMENTLKKLESQPNMSFRKYINQEKKTLYMSSIDNYKMKCVERSSNYDGVKITQLGGNKFIKNQQYNNLARLINPDILVSLTEQSEIQTGYNSIKRSAQKSAKFLKESLNELKDTQICIFGAIQGGLDIDQKIIAAETQRFAADYQNFKGLTLYGFNQEDSWREKDMAISAIQTVFHEYNLQYVLAGHGEILSILWGISWGIKGFEIEEPFRFAQNHKALLLPKLEAKKTELQCLSGDRINFYELEGKKIRFVNFAVTSDSKENVPIDPECSCVVCRKHTKLYISHLVECKEMNSQVLLTIHNIHQYVQLQQKLEEMHNQQQLNQWIRWVLQQL
ncbi:unnamed protein product (macronuclear) [Paramecium tetraurelia]|uniref:tRNA-guanine(15) transglycosylase-like domain-containing protein n=1 Tax=Paramecium tetraurelia TaxID=5888 RepID=A0C4Y3_PARTE|nr:uncharacterized protein GSPATT00006349001 [Paramecium tetraurelia]CAK65850.1 unnamed protein product [Paramecium tetraurelia]|eukprot:XP_001433247.1 hypothetical protein (macronuclear) [Paramecium tetraurelia strain d4-2]